jgi:uncharacterized protein (UPF0276 family)
VSRFGVPDLGIGVGFRVPHYLHVVENRPEMDWFEVISENFMVDGGSPIHYLNRLLETYPVVLHGVSMNIGGTFRDGYLDRLAALCEIVDPPWLSDHVCFTGSEVVNTHDLLPVPYTPWMIDHFVANIRAVKSRLGRVFAIENPSSYLGFSASVMPEWEFIDLVCERADCGLMFDVNNIFVSSINHGFDPKDYVDGIPHDRVVQIHLAGHSIMEGYRLDTHDAPVCDEVWELYRYAIEKIGSVSTLVEWDGNIPTWDRLAEEAARARTIRDEVLGHV